MKRIFASRHYRWFDKFNPYWNDQNRVENALYVAHIQERLNYILRVRGYVSLNEALNFLGFEQTRWGDMIGWVRNPRPGEGDGYIHFGIWDQGIAHGKDWLHGKLDVMTLRFNVDNTKDPLTYRVRKLREEGKI